MPQPTLNERFRDGPPGRRPEDKHAWLNAEEQRFILWGLKERWSAARIGRALGINEATVRRFRSRVWDSPELLLELGLYEMVGRAKDDEYRCLVCADRIIQRRKVERHIVTHFLEKAVVDDLYPIDEEEEEYF